MTTSATTAPAINAGTSQRGRRVVPSVNRSPRRLDERPALGVTYTPAIGVAEGHIDIAVLASGSGSNLQALIDTPDIRPHIRLVVADNPEAGALVRAGEAGIEIAVVAWERYPDREAFSVGLADLIESRGVKAVILAGFMRILSPQFIDRFPNRVLNIHPSLLPAFPGAHAVADALAYGVTVTGVTVHFVDEKVDHGPIIAQRAVEVMPGDTPEVLHARIQQQEHDLYPHVVRAFLARHRDAFDLIARHQVAFTGTRAANHVLISVRVEDPKPIADRQRAGGVGADEVCANGVLCRESVERHTGSIPRNEISFARAANLVVVPIHTNAGADNIQELVRRAVRDRCRSCRVRPDTVVDHCGK